MVLVGGETGDRRGESGEGDAAMLMLRADALVRTIPRQGGSLFAEIVSDGGFLRR